MAGRVLVCGQTFVRVLRVFREVIFQVLFLSLNLIQGQGNEKWVEWSLLFESYPWTPWEWEKNHLKILVYTGIHGVHTEGQMKSDGFG
jgi:hypothetical protein